MYSLRVVGIYDSDACSAENAFTCEGESMARQEFKDECDINTIIERFGIGENPIETQQWVTNIDIHDAPDNYQDVMNQLNEARDQFMSLPAKVRSQFNNSPYDFMNFVSNPENGDEMVRLGLAERRPDPVPSDTDRIILAIENSAAQSSS